MGSSRRHLAAAAYASHLLPFEVMLLSMLVEEHKQVLRLQQDLDALKTHMDTVHGDTKAVGAIHKDANNVGEIHEFPLQYEGDNEPVAGDIDKHHLRKNDWDLDPGGHV